MFLSGIFVPVAGLPDGLRQIAEFNPLTSLATAMRELFGTPDRAAAGRLDAAAPGDHVADLGRRADGGLRAALDPPLPADGPLSYWAP